jgi:hypothetical protein
MFAPGTAIISAGAKFSTSPSVYVGFQSLYATDFCGTVGGNVYSATTLAFKQGDLCTAPAYFWNSAEYNASQPFLFPVYTRATWEAQEVDIHFFPFSMANTHCRKGCTDITNSFYQWATSEIGADDAYYFGVETDDVLPMDGLQTRLHFIIIPLLTIPARRHPLCRLSSSLSVGFTGVDLLRVYSCSDVVANRFVELRGCR